MIALAVSHIRSWLLVRGECVAMRLALAADSGFTCLRGHLAHEARDVFRRPAADECAPPLTMLSMLGARGQVLPCSTESFPPAVDC